MRPIAPGWGTDPRFRAPMASVVIGGLITSTFVGLQRWWRRIRGVPAAAAQQTETAA